MRRTTDLKSRYQDRYTKLEQLMRYCYTSWLAGKVLAGTHLANNFSNYVGSKRKLSNKFHNLLSVVKENSVVWELGGVERRFI